MITYGFSTTGCPDPDMDSALELCIEYGLDFLELRAPGGRTDVLEYFKQNKTPAGMSKVRVPASSFALLGENEKTGKTVSRSGTVRWNRGEAYNTIS
jgi:hypothetical protein